MEQEHSIAVSPRAPHGQRFIVATSWNRAGKSAWPCTRATETTPSSSGCRSASSALLDRFDLVVTVPRPRAEHLAAGPSEPSAPVRERVAAGRARLAGPLLKRTSEAENLLSHAVERLPLSGRGRARVARVARTAAALAGDESVRPEHVAEALAYRSPKELAS